MSNTNRIKAFLDSTVEDEPDRGQFGHHVAEGEEGHDPAQCLYCWANQQEQTYGPVLVTDMLAEMAHQSVIARDAVHQSWTAFCARDWGACSPTGLEVNDAALLSGAMVLGVYSFGMFKVAILSAPGRRVVSISLFQEAESAAIAATMAAQATGAPLVRLPIDDFRRRL